jgi:hypothetical protein
MSSPAPVVKLFLQPVRYVARRILGRSHFRAIVSGDYVQIGVFYRRSSRGFSELFEAKIMRCEGIRMIFIMHMNAMFGDRDAPIDDEVSGIENIEKYPFVNHMMLFREIFPGYNIEHFDLERFKELRQPFEKRLAVYRSLLLQKAPLDIADKIVSNVTPYWLSAAALEPINRIEVNLDIYEATDTNELVKPEFQEGEYVHASILTRW